MKCPACGKKMEAGYLYTGGNRVLWTKLRRRWSTIPEEGDVVLQPMTLDSTLGGRNDLSAWICEDCRKVVLDY